MIRQKIIAGLLAICIPLVALGAERTVDENGQLTGATEVWANGSFWDVVFDDGAWEFFPGEDLPAKDKPQADAFGQALLDQVFVDEERGTFDSDPETTNGCENDSSCTIFTPYFVDATSTTFSLTFNQRADGVQDDFVRDIEGVLGLTGDFSDATARVLARWTPSSNPVSTGLVQVSFSGFIDNDPSGALGGDLSYSGTIVYDPSVAPVSVTTSDGCCPDSTKPTTSKLYDIVSFELTIGGTSVSGESPQVSITDSTSPTSDGVSFTARIPALTLGGVTFTNLTPRLGSFGLNTAFSDIGLDGVADVYLTPLFNQDFELFGTGLQDADEAGINGTAVTFVEIAPVSYQFTGSIVSAQGIYSGIPRGAEVSAAYTFDGNAVGNVLFGNNREDFDNAAIVNRDQADIWRATLQVEGVSLATVDGQRLGIVADTGGVFTEALYLTSQRGLSNGTVDISVPSMQIGFFGDLYDGLGVLTGDMRTDVIQVLDTLDLGSLTSQVTQWQTLSETGELLGTLIWNVTSLERASQGELDTEPPVWSVPADITVSASGAAVTYNATVSDNVAVTSQSCAPASGNVFPIGTTTVSCVASDAAGNTASASFTVTVIDDQRPSWSIPADISVIATSLSGAEVNYTAVASDNVGVVSASCVPASATVFPVGSTVVTCTATDAAGNTAEAAFNVVVGVNTASSNTLIDGIADLGLPTGVEASLQSTLGQIDRLINDSNPDNDSAVCDKLAEFLIKVGEREADGSLTTEQSSSLSAFAQAMQATFGCIL